MNPESPTRVTAAQPIRDFKPGPSGHPQNYPSGKKICTQCREEKPLDQFHRRKRIGGIGYYPKCRSCKKDVKMDAELMRMYGLSRADYERRLQNQNGLCAICLLPPKPSERLAPDHDHETGQVRGLIHRRCNSAIGFFDDDPELLERAAAYLRRAKIRLVAKASA